MGAKPAKRRARKHLRSTKVAQWIKQANWLSDIIEEIHECQSAHGIKWQANMIRHYAKQWVNHRTPTPKGEVARRDEIDKRIAAIIDHYSETA